MFQRGIDLAQIILLTRNEFPRLGGASVGFDLCPSAIPCRKYPQSHPASPCPWVAGALGFPSGLGGWPCCLLSCHPLKLFVLFYFLTFPVLSPLEKFKVF